MPIVRARSPIVTSGAGGRNVRRRQPSPGPAMVSDPREAIARFLGVVPFPVGLGDFTTVASTIQTVEGWFPGSVSYRNNNPGNLKYAGQPGAIGQDSSGFAIFPTYAAGEQALENQITLDASRGLTISQFAAKYAPAQDSNDPVSYAAQIAAATGLSVNDPLSAADTGMVANMPLYADNTGSGGSLSDIVGQLTSGQDNTGLYVGLGVLAGGLLLALA